MEPAYDSVAMGVPLPDHPVLASVARAVDDAGQAGLMADAGWRVVWFSQEWGAYFGRESEDEFAGLIGTNVIHFTLSPPMRRVISERSLLRAGVDLVAAVSADVPGGKAALGQWIEEELGEGGRSILDGLEPNPMPVWPSSVNVAPHGMAPTRNSWLGIRLFDPAGTHVGHLMLFGTAIPFRYVPMLALGDPAALERIASLTKPARHDVVVLSADLQGSAVLARRLSTAAFFDLITRTISRSDRRIVERGGMVGRHAGDGVMAFFLAEHVGGASSAARAAIEVATSLGTIVDEAASESVPAHVPVNVALHWGNVFMGQLVSEGRLEVSALGDAVNECARIAECARDGAVLASKGVIEQLDDADASAVGIDPAKVAYDRLEDLPNASTKARRDAGGIAVTRLA